jgi:cob(I)alamin adenosyltransferase
MTDRIYTRTGDAGETGLFGGGRVPKSHPRVEAYGAIDELNAHIGVAAGLLHDTWLAERLRPIQADLFTIGAHLATPEPAAGRARPKLPGLPVERVADLERWIDHAEASLTPLRTFILPGGSPGGASLHVCRTVCRRAERRVVQMAVDEPVDPLIITLLNRLSDFLFVAARFENAACGVADVNWDASGRATSEAGS